MHSHHHEYKDPREQFEKSTQEHSSDLHEYKDSCEQFEERAHDHSHEHPYDHSHDHNHSHSHDHGHHHGHGHTHSPEHRAAVINRLSRAIGHLEKVKRMVEADADCSEVLTQLAAVRGALNNTAKLILRDHISHCVVEAVEHGDQQTVEDLITAIDKFMK